LYHLINGVIKLIVVIIEEYYFYQLHTKFRSVFFFQSELRTQTKLLGITSLDFDVTGQLLVRILHSSDTGKKMEYNG